MLKTILLLSCAATISANSCSSIQTSYSGSECCSGSSAFQLPAVSNPDVTKHVSCYETFKFDTFAEAEAMSEMLKMFLMVNGTISGDKVTCSIYLDPTTNTTSCYSVYKTMQLCMNEKLSLYANPGVIQMFDGLKTGGNDVKCYFSFSSEAELTSCKSSMFSAIDTHWTDTALASWFKGTHMCAYEKPSCAFWRSPFY